tara:strand:+ start:6473 stop:7654 length:1182 start_codon:yes stop_codon:yes gene_type:complete
MGIARGSNIIKDGLIYGYDSGYGVSNNATSTRFYPGEPTTNVTPLTSFFNLSNWTGGGWSGSAAYSSTYDNALEFTVTNGWRTFAIDHGITSGGTVSVSFEYRLKSQQTANIYGLVLNGLNLGNYHNNVGNISNADLEDSLANGWKSYTGSFTANNNTYGSKLAIGLRGTDNGGLTDVLIIRKLQVEQKSHSTPYTETSRGNTGGLIDLKRTRDITLANMSFDSTGQPTFDGTDDKISTGITTQLNAFSCVAVFKDGGSATWGRIVDKSYTTGFFISSRWNGNASHVGAGVREPNAPHGQHLSYDNTKYNYFAVTRDGANHDIYLNGSSNTASKTNGDSSTLSSTEMTIGAWYDNRSSQRYTGEIPVVKLYNKKLSAAEIEQDFKAYKNRFNL